MAILISKLQRKEARYRLTEHMENGRKASSLRWGILRRALIPTNSSTGPGKIYAVTGFGLLRYEFILSYE